jgi:hypothetical protein
LVFGIGTALLFGFLVRSSFVIVADFPLNDGGMFYTMAGELQANGYRLPEFTSYNFGGIPFAYPPFGLYVAAVVDDFTPLSMLDVFRILPLIVTVGTMCAFGLLARRLLADDVAFIASLTAFALIPFSYEWFIMGGGLTRSLGMLFALLALHEAHRLYTGRNRRCIASVGVLAGLCALSHLEMLLFLAFSIALFFAAYGRSKSSARDTALAVVIALAISAPWWATVLAYHGLDPFLAAARTGSPSPVNPALTFLVFQPTDEPLFAIIAALGLLGIAWSLAHRQWMLPAWVLACGLLDPRGFGNVACVPIALLTGIAVADVLLPMLSPANPSRARGWILPSAVFGVLALYALIGAMVATPQLLAALEPDEREAMIWIENNTPRDATVAVVTDEHWARDRAAEWLPVLAERRSIATVQGTEWARGEFSQQNDLNRELQLCAEGDTACLNEWMASNQVEFDYLFLPKRSESMAGMVEHPDECCAALRAALRADARYRVMFDNPGATVFCRCPRVDEPSGMTWYSRK